MQKRRHPHTQPHVIVVLHDGINGEREKNNEWYNDEPEKQTRKYHAFKNMESISHVKDFFLGKSRNKKRSSKLDQ